MCYGFPFEIEKTENPYVGFPLWEAQYKQAEKFIAHYQKLLLRSKKNKDLLGKIKKHENVIIKIRNEYAEEFI